MDYLNLLKNSYRMTDSDETILGYLSNYIFGFTTYDGDMDELFAGKALEICRAITEKKTFEYIEDPDNYKWFLLMCNMPFFNDKIQWGTSIRGAWWGVYPRNNFVIKSCGIWDGENQIMELLLDESQFISFINAVIDFSALDAEQLKNSEVE